MGEATPTREPYRSPVIVVIGEALVDLVGEPDWRYRPVPGGSPPNVAVGLARLGAPTELLARLGTGVFGATVREHLIRNGIGLSHAVRATEPTTLAVVTPDDTGLPGYDFYVLGDPTEARRLKRGVTVNVPAWPVQVADAVGAGDAFTSGWSDALRRHACSAIRPAATLRADSTEDDT